MGFTIKDERERKSFEQPKPGVYTAICTEVRDLGMVPGYNPGETKHALRLRWELGDTDSAGNRFTVVKEYTASLNEKANLRKDLEAWLGAFDEQDIKAGVDLDELVINKSCQLSVGERTSKQGNPYTVVNAIMPLGPGMEPLEPLTPSEDEPPF